MNGTHSRRTDGLAQRARPWVWLWLPLLLCVFRCAGAGVPGMDPTHSRVVEWTGVVEVSLTNAPFVPVTTNAVLRVGDRLRTGKASRATLQLSDRSVVRVAEGTVVEIRRPTSAEGERRFQLRSGILYFLNRERPASVEFETPLVSGAIRGTEFRLAVEEGDGTTALALVTGAVALTPQTGSASVRAGEEIELRPDAPARVRPILDFRRGIQWAFHYPWVLDLDESGLEKGLPGGWEGTVAALRAGDVTRARVLMPEADGPGSAGAAGLLRAGLELAVGRVPEAERVLAGVTEPGLQGGVAALRELIGSVIGAEAVRGAAVPTGASGWLARSYVLQVGLDPEGAWRAAVRATASSPRFGAAWVRRAELALMTERRRDVVLALGEARGAASRHAGAMVVAGYVAMEARRWGQAREAFEGAIAVDGSLPTAWLGLGLLETLEGRVTAGLSALQVAAVLEPQRAAYRAALGKGFSAAGEDALAMKEFRVAKELDAADPTPWFYAGLQDLQMNRYNAAVRNLEGASERNDGHAIFRTRQQLDRDQAMRSADLGVAYGVTGLEEVAWRSSTRAVIEDYTDFSGHLFTARSLAGREDPSGFDLRWETARQSELLVANLLAPPGAGNLSRVLSQQDHLRTFGLAPVGMASVTEYASRGDWEQTGSVFGQVASVGYAVDSQYRSLRGQGPGQGQERFRASVQVRFDLGPDDALLLQTGVEEWNAEDVARRLDPSVAGGLRAWGRRDPEFQAGYRHGWAPGVVTLGLVSHGSDRLRLEDADVLTPFVVQRGGAPAGIGTVPGHRLEQDSRFEVTSVELQQVVQGSWQGVVLGGRYQGGTVDTVSRLEPVLPGPVIGTRNEGELERANGYAYWQVRPARWVRLWAGLAYDHVSYPGNADLAPVAVGGTDAAERSRWSPKVALALEPWKGGELRAAYTRSMGGLYFDDSLRLEPGQLAGFGQSYRSLAPESVVGLVPATVFETVGVRFDQRFPGSVYGGVELLRMESDGARGVGVLTNSLPFPVADSPSQLGQEVGFVERTVAGYLGVLLGESWSAGVRPRVTEAELETRFPELPVGLPGMDGMAGVRRATLVEVGLWVRLNHESGVFAGWDSTWRAQWRSGLGGRGEEDFWQHDLHVGYRWPRRHAEIRVGIQNLADTDYRLDPLNLMVEPARGRLMYGSLRLNF